MPKKIDTQAEETAPEIIKMMDYVRDVINKYLPRLSVTVSKSNGSGSTLKESVIAVKCFLECQDISGEKTHCFSCYELQMTYKADAFIRMKIRRAVIELVEEILKLEGNKCN